MEAATVPIYRCDLGVDGFLKGIYSDPGEKDSKRYKDLIAGFRNKYGKSPEIIGRSPGRVNLIGEHIDYMGYPVLPMAIRQDTIVAIGKAEDGRVHVSNQVPGFRDEEFETNPDQLKARTNYSWVNYIMASYKGVCGYVKSKGGPAIPAPVGLNIHVEGQVPQGSGLSSSAALVCSTALALLGLLDMDAAQEDVAQFTAECEKFVGTESGGMDQAISIMGELELAKMVHFHPKIWTENVPLPDGAMFVIANSLTESAKAVSADKQYNLRVVECRLATALLALELGGDKVKPKEAINKTLKDVKDLVEAAQAKGGAKDPNVPGANVAVVEQALKQEVYTWDELQELLDIKKDDTKEGEKKDEKIFNDSQQRAIAAAEGSGFKPRDRAVHVYTEAARVELFKKACEANIEADQKLKRLADLMDESHASCRDRYECSCEELDRLVEISKKAGAMGSRLTGAGWGGCTVSLVRKENVDAFITKVKQDYYVAGVNSGDLSERYFKSDGQGGWTPVAGWENVIFASPPGSGGAILKL